MGVPGNVARKVGLLAVLGLTATAAYYAHAAGNAIIGFSYSGQLKSNGAPAAGGHDFAFDLVDGSGGSVGCPTDNRDDLMVTAGRFDAPNLFGSCGNLHSILSNQASLAVRITVDGQVLSPDQPLGAVPYALRAVASDSASPGGGSPPPAVPASTSWSSSSTGNAACARVKGVCSSAADGSGTPQSCSVVTASGSAACAASASIDESATWTGSGSGDAACVAQTAHCVQAYDASGNSIACNAVSANGTASCVTTTAAQGWDTPATWTQNQSGFMACATLGAHCVRAFDGGGNPVACNTAYPASGRAQCLKAGPGDAFDKGAMWHGSPTTGTIRCALQGAECLDVTWAHTNGSVGSCQCGEGCSGGSNYVMVARCKSIDPVTGPWDQTATWPGSPKTGVQQCALQDAECHSVLWQHGNGSAGSCGCNEGCSGGTSYTMLARCKTRPADAAWDSVATWPGSSTTGKFQCSLQNEGKECVDVYWSSPGGSAGTCRCDEACSGANHLMLARCKARDAGSSWDKVVTWPGTSTAGTIECARVGAECHDVHWLVNGGSAGACGCNVICAGANQQMMARCKAATPANAGWNVPATWNNLNTTGAAQCAAIGGTCVSVVDAATGSTRLCGDTFGAGGGGVAKCLK